MSAAGSDTETSPSCRPRRRFGYPDDLRGLVEEFLADRGFSTEPATAGLDEAMRYSLLAGGKRVRPVLTLATARSLVRIRLRSCRLPPRSSWSTPTR